MTGFENRAFRDLVTIKSLELERTEMEEGQELADELKRLVNKINAFQKAHADLAE